MDILSNGNKKIHNDTLIFNFTSGIECPSYSLGLCKLKTKCYARKNELLRPSTLSNRRTQEKLTDLMVKNNDVDTFLGIWDHYTKFRITNKIKFFRFSESGDFKTQNHVNWFSTLCSEMSKSFPEISIYGYTAREDLNFSALKKFAVLNGQYFKATNKIIIVPKIPNGVKNICNGKSCANCNLCKKKTGNIYFKLH